MTSISISSERAVANIFNSVIVVVDIGVAWELDLLDELRK